MQEEPNYGIFTQSSDVGNVRNKGKTVYEPPTEKFIISGSGTNMWHDTDEFHFVWKKVRGDFILYSEVAFQG